jgi:TPR repeat protein
LKILPLFAILAATLLAQGCYTPLIEGAQQGYDGARRSGLEAAAESGAPTAQYKLGDTYCCMGGGPMDKVSIYDNRKATFWYCKAARQEYWPAQLRLAQLYSGRPLHGLHVALRVSALAGSVRTDPGLALMWAGLAAERGSEDAIELRDAIRAHGSEADHARASLLKDTWRTAPCEWAEVFPQATSSLAPR